MQLLMLQKGITLTGRSCDDTACYCEYRTVTPHNDVISHWSYLDDTTFFVISCFGIPQDAVFDQLAVIMRLSTVTHHLRRNSNEERLIASC